MGLGTHGLTFSWNFQNMIRLSHYQNIQLYFFPNIHGCHGNQTQRFSLQNSKMTNWLCQKSLFFSYFLHAKLYLFLLFSIQIMKETTLSKYFCIISTRYIFFPYIIMATPCREVYQTFRLNENFHIFSKFENLCKNCRPIWSLQFISFKRVTYVGTYMKKTSVGTS